jgi:hypothetical protein
VGDQFEAPFKELPTKDPIMAHINMDTEKGSQIRDCYHELKPPGHPAATKGIPQFLEPRSINFLGTIFDTNKASCLKALIRYVNMV